MKLRDDRGWWIATKPHIKPNPLPHESTGRYWCQFGNCFGTGDRPEEAYRGMVDLMRRVSHRRTAEFQRALCDAQRMAEARRA